MLATVFFAWSALVGFEHDGAAEAAFAVAGHVGADVADRGGDRFEVDPGLLQRLLQLVRRHLAGDAFFVDLVDAS